VHHTLSKTQGVVQKETGLIFIWVKLTVQKKANVMARVGSAMDMAMVEVGVVRPSGAKQSVFQSTLPLAVCARVQGRVLPKVLEQLCKVIAVLAADSHNVETVTVSYFCRGSQSREVHELAMQTAPAGTLLLRYCLASASARMLVLLKLVMAALLPVGISILPIQIGMLPTVMGMLPIAIGELPIAIVVLPIAIGVLPIAIVGLANGLLLIAILLMGHHVLLVQITTRTTLVPIRLTRMLAKTICIRQMPSRRVSAAWLLMRQVRGRILKVALSVARLRLLPGALWLL